MRSIARYLCTMRWELAQWFEIRWWQGYLKDRDKEEYLSWKRNYWSTFLASIEVETGPSYAVLDAGCGPAGIFTFLQADSVWAIDPLLMSYEQRLPQFSRSDYPHVHFEEIAVESLQASERFDQVFCLNVINHVADIERAYDALVEGLKVGGTLVLSIDSHNTQFFRWLFRLVPLDILHPYQYSLQEYETALRSRGVDIHRVKRVKSGILFDYYAIVGTKK